MNDNILGAYLTGITRHLNKLKASDSTSMGTMKVVAELEMLVEGIYLDMRSEHEQQTQVPSAPEPKPKKTRKKKEAKIETVLDTSPSQDRIEISCDASIKTNPGGPAAVGVVVKVPGKNPVELAKGTSANTNNEAEYDAVYTGLQFIATTMNRPKWPIVIFSDSQLVVKQLNGQYKTNDNYPELKKKCQLIHELAASMSPALISIEWKPRNSTPELEKANFLAQDVLGVKRH